jgi:Tfp pilus assembly protein PilO
MYTAFKRIIGREILPVAALVFSIFIFTVIARVVILPVWLTGSADRTKVFRYRTLISGQTDYEELKKEIREKQALLEKKHTNLTEGLADPRDLSGLLQMIVDKAWNADIRFDKIIPQHEVRGEDYIHYPVLLEMQTNFNSLGKFISSLERMPQIVSVDRVAMTAKNGTSIQGLILITCYLNKKGIHESDKSSQK